MFGNLGGGELLILIVAVALIWIIIKLLKNVSRIESWVSRGAEERFLSNVEKVKVAHKVYSKLWWLPLPFAAISVLTLVFSICILIVIFTVISDGILPSWLESTIDFLILGMYLGCIIIGLFIHFRPGGNRKLKYEFLLAGTSIYSITFFILVGKILSISNISKASLQWWVPRPEFDPEIMEWTLITWILYIIIIQIIISFWIGPLDKAGSVKSLSPTIIRNYSLIRRAGYGFALFSFSGITQPLLIPYLILRYMLVEKMSNSPILYLRSFHYVEGPTAFGNIVSRVASRYGVLLALVHQSQRPLELHANTRLTERAELAKTPDDAWQNWIKEQMLRASVIIIDYSIDTQGLNWELDCAVSLVNSSKILILNNKDYVVHTPSNIWKLEYEMGPDGEKEAREKLNEHLHTLFFNS